MLERDDAVIGKVAGGVENGFEGSLVGHRVHSPLIGGGVDFPIYTDS
jgi:hypothetical protein